MFTFEPWHVDFIKSKVHEMKGELNVRIYAPEGTYKIWYYNKRKEALFARAVWSGRTEREQSVPASPEEMLRAMNTEGTRINVQYSNNQEKSQWFGPDHGMQEISQAYEYIASFKGHSKDSYEEMLPEEIQTP